jgi:serine protease Do
MNGVRYPSLRRRCSPAALVLFAGLLACAGAPARHGARGSSPGEAVVRVCFKPKEGETRCTGSGTVIDRRGYVLTAFHVVGRVYPDDEHRAGSMFADEGYQAEIAVASSDREGTTRRYPARIVRADASLDLALLRVESPKRSFRALPLRPANAPVRVGETVTASGFMGPFETVHRGFGHVAGLDPNRRGDLAWLRLDVLFQPGMSGGAVTDERGRLLAVPITIFSARSDAAPVSLARPVDRIPRAWLDALARGEIDDFVMTGIPDLAADGRWSGTLVADDSIGGKVETRYFTMTPWKRGVVRVRPSDALVRMLDGFGQIIRADTGQLEVIADEAEVATLAVEWPLTADGPLEVSVEFAAGEHGRAPPTSTLELGFIPDPDAKTSPMGSFAVLEPGADAEGWRARLLNPDKYAGEPATGAFFVGTYAAGQRVKIPGAVRGRRYTVVAVPDSGATSTMWALVLARDPHYMTVHLH